MRRAAVPAAAMCLATRFQLAAATLEAAAPWAATNQAGGCLLVHPPSLPSHLYIMLDSLYCTTLGSRDVLRNPLWDNSSHTGSSSPLGSNKSSRCLSHSQQNCTSARHTLDFWKR
jgi:hypothetical protein